MIAMAVQARKRGASARHSVLANKTECLFGRVESAAFHLRHWQARVAWACIPSVRSALATLRALVD